MTVLNPTFLDVLWQDPAGIKIVEAVVFSMLCGVLLIFCIFPALLTVLLRPAFIHIYRVLLPTLGS